MSDQKNTPEAGSPPPAKESMPDAFPDLSAHSDSPAWLSRDGSHDAGIWQSSFEDAANGGPDVAGTPAGNPDLPAEPVVTAAEELTLEEPSLADPTLGDDAVQAASLDEVTSETAAVEANAAEAGRLSGLEPAPAGAEIPVDPDAAGAGPESRARAGENEPEEEISGSDPHPLQGINAAAPVTGAHPGQERPAADTAAPQEPAPAAAVPAGDTRRSRRLAEGQAAGATRKQGGKAPEAGADSGTNRPETGSTAAAAAGGTPVKDSGKSNRNTRLLLVLGGIVLAAVVAILLFVFVFNAKEEGVISEDVSPVDLESGACLQDWDDVNSSATVVTCETPHNAQLVATDSFSEDAEFPGTAALEERVNEVCETVDYADAAAQFPDLLLTKSIPTEQSWSTGDRRVDCFVFAPEGEELTESLLRG